MSTVKRLFNRIKNKYQSIRNPNIELEKLIERGLRVGKNFHMYNSSIDQSHCFLIEIGDDVTIAHSIILAHDACIKKDLGVSKVGKVKIGDRVFIGHKSVVFCNVTIGDDVIIKAGSIVTEDIPSDSVVMGNPARIIGRKSDYLEMHKQNLKEKPNFMSYVNKTQEEKNIMNSELENTFGYDL